MAIGVEPTLASKLDFIAVNDQIHRSRFALVRGARGAFRRSGSDHKIGSSSLLLSWLMDGSSWLM